MKITRIGDFRLDWGESLCWDDERGRLYFVDCMKQTLHWLENAELPLHTRQLTSLPTGLGLADDGRVLIAMDSGLCIVNPDDGAEELIAPYPDGMGGRANDLGIDASGAVVTGSLNLDAAPGSYWRYFSGEGWTQLDDDITNTNGPVFIDISGHSSLVIADTPAGILYAYDYDHQKGVTGKRRVFANTAELEGMPDGACADDEGGVLSGILGPGLIARYTADGLDRTIDVGVEMPSDVAFGGTDLDRLFVVSISVAIRGLDIRAPNAGGLLVLEGTGLTGRKENRFRYC